jgi:hypothetical protein
MMNHAEVRELSDRDLWDKYTPVFTHGDSSNAANLYRGEIERREFLARQANGRTADRIKILTLWLVGAGVLQATATGWPYLVWWVRHGFRFQ